MAGVMIKVTCVMVVCMILAAPYSEAAVSNCEQVLNKMFEPCLDYLKKGGTVKPACCAAVKRLNTESKTPKDKKHGCDCMKVAFKMYPGIKADLAGGLPTKCGIKGFPYQIGPKPDCSKLKK